MTLRCVDNTLAHLHLAAEQNDGPAKTTLKGKPGAKTSSRSFFIAKRGRPAAEPERGTCGSELLLLLQELQNKPT